ncbi:MAG: GtrA family protein [Clostridia bacterium]|nr:GtrA family protein [Clostridia bacterium]
MKDMNKIVSKVLKKVLSREFITYGVFGVLTMLFNILVFQILFEKLAIAYGIANIIAVLSAKIFAYVTNKLFVFRSHCANFKELFLEIIKYVFARGFTGLIDIFGMFFAVELLHADEMMTKYVIQVIVIVLNYILGKKVVFKKHERNKNVEEIT